MSYSDQDLFVASQLAYYEISVEDLAYLKKKGIEPTLANILDYNTNVKATLDKNLEDAKTPLAVSKAEADLDLYEEFISPDSEYSSWKVVDIKDDNQHSGFYGLLVETNPNNAIVGFRGSEAHGNQFEKDWVNTDFKMINEGVGVDQQKIATEYMAYINSQYPYDAYATAGHSLGGNLSFYAAITAPPEMRAKIIQALNGDGPGFAEEFLNNPLYADGIRDMTGKMNHYQWSLVGAILNPVPGSNYMSLQTKDNVYGDYGLGALTAKHSMTFVDFDEHGRVIKGEMDRFAESIGRFTREMDELPAGVGNALIHAVEGFMSLPDGQKKLLAGALIANIGLFLATHPIALIATVLVGVTLGVIAWINPEFFGEVLIPFLLDALSFTADMVQKLIDGVTAVIAAVLEAANMAKEFVNKIIANVGDVITGFISWAKMQLNPGYKYASAHPLIKVDTQKLRNYAQRLSTVNKRLNNLDRSLDSLYSKVELVDLWSLLQADLMTGESWKIKRHISYLEETAEDFEATERKIMNNLG
ncbi:Mbeg1-like protein [Bacillus sp. OK048]|uniref:Mbeg1-like protein n=1 Tax=Bacillus sp. OK048 TaxID=1882761 RepID=UPI00087F16D6|nr:Mbeg1-like protein [Bacillus sp. OK048]SDM84996.1 Protein of unknown function [Bacillus sp. OK048]